MLVHNLSISSNDDAYLYVNGYSVKSTAYAQAGNVVSMVDASDYSNNEYVMINGRYTSYWIYYW
jgi:hypothetical protein